MMLVAFTASGAVSAQTRAVTARAPAAESSRDAARAELRELQQIRARLQTAHNRASSDDALRTAQQALARDIKEAMEQIDPELPALADRVRRMEAEASAAQSRGDEARLQVLTRDFATIRQRFLRVQTEVLQRPDLAQRAQRLDEELHRRMLAVEPQTDSLLARSRELQERLRGALSGARPRQATPRGTP